MKHFQATAELFLRSEQAQKYIYALLSLIFLFIIVMQLILSVAPWHGFSQTSLGPHVTSDPWGGGDASYGL